MGEPKQTQSWGTGTAAAGIRRTLSAPEESGSGSRSGGFHLDSEILLRGNAENGPSASRELLSHPNCCSAAWPGRAGPPGAFSGRSGVLLRSPPGPCRRYPSHACCKTSPRVHRCRRMGRARHLSRLLPVAQTARAQPAPRGSLSFADGGSPLLRDLSTAGERRARPPVLCSLSSGLGRALGA